MYDFSYNNQGSAVSLVLKLGRDDQIDNLSMGMMMNNNIPGFLSVSRRYIDNDVYLYYDVSSLAPLTSAYYALCQDKYLIHFLLSFCRTVKECGEYLLDSKKLCLIADYVFVHRATGEFRAVFIPVETVEEGVTPYEFVREIVAKIGENTMNDSVVMPVLYRLVIAESMFSVDNLERQLTDLQTSGKLRADTRANTSADRVQDVGTSVKEESFYEQKQPSAYTPTPKPVVSPEPEPIPVPETETSSDAKEEGGLMKILGGLMGSSKGTAEPAKKEKNASGLSLGGLMSKKKAEPADNAFSFDNPFAGPSADAPVNEKPVEEVPAPKKERGGISMINPFGGSSANHNQKTVEKQQKPAEKTPAASGYDSASTGGGYTLSLDGGDSGAPLATSLMMDDAGEERRIALVRRANGQRTVVTHNNFHIGRGQNLVDLYVDSKTMYIGTDHAYIMLQGSEYFVVDNNSRNHTWLNGKQLECSRPYAIHPGDILRLADEYFDVTDA